MAQNPLAEVFGFPTDNLSPEAKRFKINKLCPFNNKSPNCTKDKANDPLGVCSVMEGNTPTITCPIRCRQVGLTRFREPITVKRSGSVKGVEIDGKEGQALLA